MIKINLLPDTMRKREGLPFFHFLGLVASLAILGGLVFMITKYYFDTIPTLEAKVTRLSEQKRLLDAQVAELKDLNSQISRMSGYVDAVKTLYRRRIVWSKVLSDIKNIVNFDSSMNIYNNDMKYLWVTNLKGGGKSISLNCYATASNQLVAMQMPEQLIKEFLTYAPVSLPEKDEESRLVDELEKARAEHETERANRPELPLQGPQELAIRQRLEEIKTIKSGGIALVPFHELLVPGSLKMGRANWNNAPRPPGRGAMSEAFPDRAWQFGLTMTLK